MSSSSPRRFQFSFSACGWLKSYQFGVAKALQEILNSNCPHDDDTPLSLSPSTRHSFCGASGGSLVAAALSLGIDPDEILNHILKYVKDCRSSLFNAFRLRHYVNGAIDAFESGDAYGNNKQTVLSGEKTERLSVAVSLLPRCSNVMINTFSSPDELREALLASCCMTPLAGFPFQLQRDDLKGQWAFDGGLTAFQPQIRNGKITVSVSPFYWSKADIVPSEYVPNQWAIYPPEPHQIEKLYQLGYRDTMRWWYTKGPGMESIPRRMPSSLDNRSFPSRLVFKRPSDAWTPSSIFGDAAFVAVHCFVKPAAYSMLYFELFCRAYVSASASVIGNVEAARRSLFSSKNYFPVSIREAVPNIEKMAEDAWGDVQERCKLLIDPSLLFSALPFAGSSTKGSRKGAKTRKSGLEAHSLVYRFFKFHNIF